MSWEPSSSRPRRSRSDPGGACSIRKLCSTPSGRLSRNSLPQGSSRAASVPAFNQELLPPLRASSAWRDKPGLLSRSHPETEPPLASQRTRKPWSVASTRSPAGLHRTSEDPWSWTSSWSCSICSKRLDSPPSPATIWSAVWPAGSKGSGSSASWGGSVTQAGAISSSPSRTAGPQGTADRMPRRGAVWLAGPLRVESASA